MIWSALINDLNLEIDHSCLETRRLTDMVVIHHTGNPSDDDLSAAEIDASHKARGWAYIGYHYVVRKDGTVEQGRPHWTIGAHAYGHNSHIIGIHVCGNFEEAEPTDEQIESTAMLLANLCTDYGCRSTATTSSGIVSSCRRHVPAGISMR